MVANIVLGTCLVIDLFALAFLAACWPSRDHWSQW